MADIICYNWETADFNWEGNEYTWNDVCFVLEFIGGGGKETFKDRYDKLDDKKRKKMIKLIIKVKGETITQEKSINTYKVTAEDIELTINEVLKAVSIEINKI